MGWRNDRERDRTAASLTCSGNGYTSGGVTRSAPDRRIAAGTRTDSAAPTRDRPSRRPRTHREVHLFADADLGPRAVCWGGSDRLRSDVAGLAVLCRRRCRCRSSRACVGRRRFLPAAHPLEASSKYPSTLSSQVSALLSKRLARASESPIASSSRVVAIHG